MNEIINKAKYCLNCKVKPCMQKGCPLNNDIPAFIEAVRNNDIKKAYEVISKTSVLPGVCGRICPHLKQCQGSCVRGIKGQPVSIGDIEAYVFDKAMEQKLKLNQIIKTIENKKGKKVAIIGGGPAGLTCAAFLAREGIEVTIYEKYNYLGGILVHGIPKFRLSKEIVKATVNQILELGIKVKYNKTLEKDIKLQELKKEYDAIFISVGANNSSRLGAKGEELEGVYGGNELLEYQNHPDYKGKIVSVIGGGNVAMDCARTIIRKGAKKVQYCRNKEK